MIVNLIANTKTRTGLTINAELDANLYPIGIKVSEEKFSTIRIIKEKFHGDWNYKIVPKKLCP